MATSLLAKSLKAHMSVSQVFLWPHVCWQSVLMAKCLLAKCPNYQMSVGQMVFDPKTWNHFVICDAQLRHSTPFSSSKRDAVLGEKIRLKGSKDGTIRESLLKGKVQYS
jgi:hypothetical protein